MTPELQTLLKTHVGANRNPPDEQLDLFRSDKVLITHVLVYALGDKYGILPLKAYAVEAFKASATYVNKMTSIGFHQAIEMVFSTTPDNDATLRNTVVDFLISVLDRLCMYPQLEEVIKRVPQLGIMLLGRAFGNGRAPMEGLDNREG